MRGHKKKAGKVMDVIRDGFNKGYAYNNELQIAVKMRKDACMKFGVSIEEIESKSREWDYLFLRMAIATSLVHITKELSQSDIGSLIGRDRATVYCYALKKDGRHEMDYKMKDSYAKMYDYCSERIHKHHRNSRRRFVSDIDAKESDRMEEILEARLIVTDIVMNVPRGLERIKRIGLKQKEK